MLGNSPRPNVYIWGYSGAYMENPENQKKDLYIYSGLGLQFKDLTIFKILEKP